MFKEPLRESSQPVTLTCSKSKPVDRQKNYSQPLTFFRLQPLTEIWTGDEDVKLKRLIDEHGTCSWTKVGESFSERTGKQCRERWYNHLDPSVKKGDWTAEEDLILSTMQRTIGNQWAKITKALPGRTDNAIKNRFHATCRALSRKDPTDYEKSSYNYNDGNTDSDSNSASGSESSARRSDSSSTGPAAAMNQGHSASQAYTGSSLFSFTNPSSYMFDDASTVSGSTQSFRTSLPTYTRSSAESSKTHKCAKKSRKLARISQDVAAVNDLHHKISGLNSSSWTHDSHHSIEFSQRNLISLQHCQEYPGTPSPLSSEVSTTCPSPIDSIISSAARAALNITTDTTTVPSIFNRTAFNGLSLRERLAPGPLHPSSPTYSEDFRMNIPSTSSIDLDEHLFDDWMDDAMIIGNSDGSNDIDVPFYRLSFEWGLSGCCSTLAPTGCFSVCQSPSKGQSDTDALCGFQRHSFGQSEPSAPSSSGFFSSLGGRICGAQKQDTSFEADPSPPCNSNSNTQNNNSIINPIIKMEQVKSEFGVQNPTPIISLQNQFNFPLTN